MTIEATVGTAYRRGRKWWHAEHIRISNIVGQASTLTGSKVAFGTNTALSLLATLQTGSVQTRLTFGACMLCGALKLRIAATTSPRIAIARDALTNCPVFAIDNTLCIQTTEHVSARRHTALDHIETRAGVARQAFAFGSAVERNTV